MLVFIPHQMLFYESAACLHGRRSRFKGKNYGSLFLHYQPVDTSIWNYSIEVRIFLYLRFFCNCNFAFCCVATICGTFHIQVPFNTFTCFVITLLYKNRM